MLVKKVDEVNMLHKQSKEAFLERYSRSKTNSDTLALSEVNR
jgi:hypothetical protein